MKRLLILALLAAAGPAAAQQTAEPPLVTDRPDFTESATIVPLGRVQLEGGYTLAWHGDDREHALGELLLRVPVAERAELRLGVNSYVWSRGPAGDASGREDATVGVKLRLADGGAPGSWRPDVALLAASSVPTGASAFRTATLQPEAVLALGWALSDRVGLGSNLNYARLGEEDARFDRLAGSVALGYAVTDRLSTYLETYGFAPDDAAGPDAGFLNGGATYLLTPTLQLDLRAGRAFKSGVGNHFAGVGLSARW